MFSFRDVVVLEKDDEIKEIDGKNFKAEENLGWRIKSMLYKIKIQDDFVSFSSPITVKKIK